MLLFVERLALVPEGVSQPIFWREYRWLWLVAGAERSVPAVLAATLAIASFLSWDVLKENLEQLQRDTGALSRDAIARLGFHVGCVVALISWSAMGASLTPSASSVIWIWARLALEIMVLASFLVAALPAPFWQRWYCGAPWSFWLGGAIGVAARILRHFLDVPWALCRAATFHMVVGILRMLGQHVIVNPTQSQIVVHGFDVEITPLCSGLDGIAITAALVAIYLYAFRRDFRFPLAIVLLPIGIALAWILNSVRIVLLILIGSVSPDLAINGFHSVAGWLSLSLVSCAVVVASRRIPAFQVSPTYPDRTVSRHAGVYLVPLLAIVATSMVTRAVHPGFDLLYPARVIVGAAALWYYRRDLSSFPPTLTMFALGAGIVVASIWIASPPTDAAFNATFAAGLQSMPASMRFPWFFMRVVGATITVPIAEELAFRGYLMRKLIANDFITVPLGTFTWISFFGSSILFGELHAQWLTGTIAGIVFAGVVCRRRSLFDAFVAHAAANVLLSAYVLCTDNWALWS